MSDVEKVIGIHELYDHTVSASKGASIVNSSKHIWLRT